MDYERTINDLKNIIVLSSFIVSLTILFVYGYDKQNDFIIVLSGGATILTLIGMFIFNSK